MLHCTPYKVIHRAKHDRRSTPQVTEENLQDYLHLFVSRRLLESIAPQIRARIQHVLYS